MGVVFDLPAAVALGQAAGGVEELSTALVRIFASPSLTGPASPFPTTGGATSALDLMRRLGDLCQTVIPGVVFWSLVGRVDQAPSVRKVPLPEDVRSRYERLLAREMDAIEGQRAFWYAYAPETLTSQGASPQLLGAPSVSAASRVSVSPASDRGTLGRLGLGIARAYQQWLGGGNQSVKNALDRTLLHERTLQRAVAGAGGLQGFPGPSAGAAQEASRAARQAFWAALPAVAAGRHPDLREAVLALLARRFASAPPTHPAQMHVPEPLDMTTAYRMVAARAG